MLRYQDINLQFQNLLGGLTPGLDQVYAYLTKRGIDRTQIDRLGLQIVTARELIQSARKAPSRQDDTRLAVVFPHFDVRGSPLDWWSARLVETGLRAVDGKGWASFTEHKWGKMYCPPQEAPRAYLPPTLDWGKLAAGDKVYIHESCIKAANGARLGRWSVGLNGVWGWTSRKHDIALVEELRGLPWKALHLQPVIVFDSNAVDNWDVRSAISALASRLFEVTGQQARHILLPKSPTGEHWGFDDYAVTHGDAAALEYLDGEGEEIETGEFIRMRTELNARVCIVGELSRIAEQDSGVLMSYGNFINVNYAPYIAEIEDTEVNVPRAWLRWPDRMEVQKLVYAPGQPRVRAGEYLNLWRGMGVEPIDGDVSLWLHVLEHNVLIPELRKWILQWFAYPLQNLGGKMTTYLHLYGPPGTGKNAILEPLLRIYGTNGVVLGRERISSDFNSIYATKQFLNLDELHGGNDKDALTIANKVKMLVTAPELVVNRKGEPEYVVKNHVNLVTSSNYADSVKLDEGDRRACVIQFGTRDSLIVDPEYWNRYYEWLDAGGSECVYAYLLGVDLAGFEPGGRAPMTEWKEEVTDATRGAMEKWVRDLWDDPDSVLPPILRGARVLTPEQVGAAYHPDDPHKNTPGLRNALGQRMKDMGFSRMELKVDGAKKRVWLMQHGATMGADDVRAELAKRSGKY